MTQEKLNIKEENVEKKPRRRTNNSTRNQKTRTEQKNEERRNTREKGETLKERKNRIETKKEKDKILNNTEKTQKEIEKILNDTEKKTNENKKENRRGSRKDIFKKSKLKIIPLGGLLEVGKNITVFVGRRRGWTA